MTITLCEKCSVCGAEIGIETDSESVKFLAEAKREIKKFKNKHAKCKVKK